MKEVLELNVHGSANEKKLQEKLFIVEGDRNVYQNDKKQLKTRCDELSQLVETLKEDLANRDRLYAKLDEENTELHKIIQGKKDIIHKEINNLIIEHKSERKNFEDTRECNIFY